MKHKILTAFLLALCAVPTLAKEVTYNLSIAETPVNFTGKNRIAMTVNGGIPGPTLRFREGDTAVLHVTNKMKVPSSIHWHGILLPPDQDGVPYISYPPIKPGTTFTYRFKIRQAGTYWYHSHTNLQEQRGVYGPIVIQSRAKKRHQVSREHVVLLSDWTDQDPQQVMRQLRRGSEAMGVKKKTAQSLLGAWKTGKTKEFWKREAMRMPPMDLADVAYDAFLINGKQSSAVKARAGETVRLRIINGSASSFFHLQYAGGPMKIIAADGLDVQTVIQNQPLLVGVAETYDVLVKVPAKGSYELRATAHDGSGSASLWVGSGQQHAAPQMPKPFVYDTMDMFGWKKMFALTPAGTMGMPTDEVKMGMFDQPGMNMHGMKMNHGGMKMKGMDHGEMNMGGKMDKGIVHNPKKWYDFLLREDAAHHSMLAQDSMKSRLRPFPPYEKLKSVRKTTLNKNAQKRKVRLTLDGNMGRYVWSFNNQPLKPENDIKINQGEVVQFVFINRTMMHHPLHLHGHFFRVINGQGDYSPLKHTVNVAPMTTTVIEFEANEVGDWFFHCHLLYHMKAGMARIVRYNGYSNDPETEALHDERYNQHWWFFAQADVLSNMTQGGIRYENQQNSFSLSWEAGWKQVKDTTWEGELTYDRYLNRFTSVFAGIYAEGVDSKREKDVAIVGFRYLLPLNIMSSTWIDEDGETRVTLERELMLTPRLGIFGEAEYDTLEKWSYQAGLSYMINENLSVTGLWDSSYGWGAGLTLKY
ncbi:hypothetical protein NT6N_04810 [Oceaniferula spumae]|uniref:Copper oxidase n=1 Tax=Oceaniferula spumae TaxID=2979115 RepID=A0AAT9FHJ5_9BACT